MSGPATVTVLLTALLAGLAALLAIGAPPSRRLERRPRSRRPAAAPRPVRTWLPVVAGQGVLVLVLALVVGGRAAVIATAVQLVADAVIGLARAELRARACLRRRTAVARAARVMAGELRMGRVGAEAIACAADECTILAPAAASLRLGGEPTAMWREQARAPGGAGLRDLARGWEVSRDTGAPLAPILEEVARALRSELALRRTIDAELAAPRATARIMGILPLIGVAMGYAIGGDPLGFLLGRPLGWACLVLGPAFAVAGVAWIEGMARQIRAGGDD